MKKFLALLLALVMVFALAACGGTDTTPASDTPDDGTVSDAPDATESEAPADETETPDDGEATGEITDPSEIPDNFESEDGVYEVAFITDIGQLQDGSFNEGTWNGVKLYAANNDKTYKYYQPANGNQATDDDRYNAMKQAVDNGAQVVVCAGYLQEPALKRAAIDFPDTMFVFIDGWALSDDDGNVLPNVAGIAFQEEQCGYLAGYAIVKEGFTKIGFSGGGGGTNAACNRYGYGYLQGASAAAQELGVTVDVMYSWQYGSGFSASPELQTMINGWYANGTEIVFACGGSMFDSIVAAASANDGYVVGVDVDQSGESDTVITSALKGITEAAKQGIEHYYNGTWEEWGGQSIVLGAANDAVGLPVDTWQLTKWTVEEYQDMLQQMKDGTLVVDNQYPTLDDGQTDDTASLNGELPNLNITVV